MPQEDDGEVTTGSDDRQQTGVRYKGSNLLYQSVPNFINKAAENDDTTSSSASRNDTGDDRRPLLAGNRPPKEKKNVRFNVRAQSMGYLDSVVPEETKRTRKSPPKAVQPKLIHNQLSGSGDELCTDEFSFISYGSPAKNRPVVSNYANASPVVRRIDKKKKNSSEASSSPDLVYDPKTNTVRLTFTKPPVNRRPTACRNEGSMRVHDPACNGKDCYQREQRYSQSYVWELINMSSNWFSVIWRMLWLWSNVLCK